VLWDLVVLAKVEKGLRRVRLVRKEGRDVSIQYGREGGGEKGLGGRERLDKRRAPRLEARARRAAHLAESRAALFLWRAL